MLDLQGALGEKLKTTTAKGGTMDLLGAMLTLSKAKVGLYTLNPVYS
jgi:hypothetical protein